MDVSFGQICGIGQLQDATPFEPQGAQATLENTKHHCFSTTVSRYIKHMTYMNISSTWYSESEARPGKWMSRRAKTTKIFTAYYLEHLHSISAARRNDRWMCSAKIRIYQNVTNMYSKNVASLSSLCDVWKHVISQCASDFSITRVSDAPSSWRTLATSCEPQVWLALQHLRGEGTAGTKDVSAIKSVMWQKMWYATQICLFFLLFFQFSQSIVGKSQIFLVICCDVTRGGPVLTY